MDNRTEMLAVAHQRRPTSKGTVPLQPDLVSRIVQSPSPRRRRTSALAFVLCFGAVFLASLGAVVGYRVARQDAVALRRMAQGFLEPLSGNDLEAALALCGEGDTGALLLLKEEARTAADLDEVKGPSPHAADRARESRLESLAEVRSTLTDQGVVWNDIQLLAFGGAQAHVFVPGAMKEPALGVVGEIYFASGDGVFAVEVSARRCPGAYVVVGVWGATAVNVPAKKLESFSRYRYRVFRQEPMEAEESATIRNPRHVFVKL